MKRSFVAILTLLMVACGGEQADSRTPQNEPEGDEVPAGSTAESALGSRADMTSEKVCEVLKSGVLNGVLDVNEESWTYRPASEYVPQALCTANAQSPDGSSSYEVGLMIMKTDFESPAAAVESLESTVRSLTEGMTIEVAGKEHTTQVTFEPFMDGVGDQAAWAPKLNELSVADQGTRFAVTVQGTGDNAENRAKAVELAHRIGDVL